MLLVNVDDVLKLIDSNIRHEGSEETDKNQFTFFDTDRFLSNLNSLPKNTFLTSDILNEVFSQSFTSGYIDYSKD